MAVAAMFSSGYPQGLHQHNENFTLQKYLLLQEQHQSLQQHINQLRPLPGMGISSVFTSPGTSPTRSSGHSSPYSSRSPSASRSHARHSSRRASLPAAPQTTSYTLRGGPVHPHHMHMILETVPDESTLAEVAVEEAKLFDINESIKRALTELLNCDVARQDHSFRTWAQCRLMETEKELRSGRRRRSAPGYDY